MIAKGNVPLIIQNSLQERGPMRVKALASIEGLQEASVRQSVRKLHLSGQVHIAGWHRLFTDADGKPVAGRPSPIWAWGPGEDAQLPSREERAKESSARHFQRWRSLGGRGYRGAGEGIEYLRSIR